MENYTNLGVIVRTGAMAPVDFLSMYFGTRRFKTKRLRNHREDYLFMYKIGYWHPQIEIPNDAPDLCIFDIIGATGNFVKCAGKKRVFLIGTVGSIIVLPWAPMCSMRKMDLKITFLLC